MVKEVEATVNPDAAIKQLRSRVALRQPLLGSGTHGGGDVGKGNRGRARGRGSGSEACSWVNRDG